MADMKVYRRLLQKVSKTKTKVLCALREEGCRQAAEMLQTPSREASATRCNACLGCTTYQTLGPCLRCLPCEREEECVEHSRLCFKWRQPATTFVAGSTVTGVSSACNLAEYDIETYKDLVDKLGDASLEIESTLDTFPAGSDKHDNDRFSSAQRQRDIMNEDEQLVLIETLLVRYQEERARLRELDEDDQSVRDDAVDVGQGLEAAGGDPVSPPAGPGRFGLQLDTHTHMQFGDLRSPPAGMNDGGAWAMSDAGRSLEAWDALGLQEHPDEDLGGAAGLLENQVDPPQVTSAGSTERVETQIKVSQAEASVSLPVSTREEPVVSTPVVTFRLEGAGGGGAITSASAIPATKPSVSNSFTVTVSSTTTRTTPFQSPIISLASLEERDKESRRRRSVLEGEEVADREPTSRAVDARLSQAKLLVTTRTQAVARDLDALVT